MIVAVIPCYNVDQYCKTVIQEVLPLVNHIIAINDGSTDRTGDILDQIATRHPNQLTIITFEKNRGKGFGILEGLKLALDHFDFDAIVTIDGDGQHNAPFLVPLAQAIKNGADLAIGARSFKKMPLRSWFGNLTISLFLRCIYAHAPLDTQSGMRAFNRDFASEIACQIPGGAYEMEFRCLLLALRQKRKIVEVPITTIYIDKNRSSHFSHLKDSMKVLKTLFLHLLGRT